jgi:hypothetical protein
VALGPAQQLLQKVGVQLLQQVVGEAEARDAVLHQPGGLQAGQGVQLVGGEVEALKELVLSVPVLHDPEGGDVVTRDVEVDGVGRQAGGRQLQPEAGAVHTDGGPAPGALQLLGLQGDGLHCTCESMVTACRLPRARKQEQPCGQAARVRAVNSRKFWRVLGGDP